MAIVNLYKEMMAAFKPYKITERAIVFVSCSTGRIPIANFIDFAKSCDYDNDYGCVHIDPTLKIVGRTFWLARGWYDGREGFIMNKHPIKPSEESTEMSWYKEDGYNDIEEGSGLIYYEEK